jgi:glycosyltransferase involved in cell wall biosynthesis
MTQASSPPKLKILFLGEPASANTRSWASGLRECGCEVTVASARPGNDPSVIPIGLPLLPARLRILTGVSSLKKIIRDVKPDILLAYRVTSYGWLAAKTGFHPLVIAAQNEQITYYKNASKLRAWFLGRCARFALQRADLTHAWAENIKRGLEMFGAAPERILTLHRGIDCSLFFPAPGRKIEFDRPKIISTRSLYPQYRIDTLIRAFAIVQAKYGDARLTITGDGPEKQNLENLARELGVAEKVVFTGRLPPEKIAELLRESDIYASLIETEGLSSSLAEAMACGTTPVAIDMSASRELIEDGMSGYLLPPGLDSEEAAEIIRDSYESGGLRERCAGEIPKMIMEKYDRRKNQEIFVDRYMRLAGKKS